MTLPITDPRWLVSTQEDECETDGCVNLAPPWDVFCTKCNMGRFGQADGLDGRGTMRAADLPARAWDATWPQRVPDDFAEDEELPVNRKLCLSLSPDVTIPLQCRLVAGHAPGCDWETDKGSLLPDVQAERLRAEQDTPSGVLPRRTPGAALGDAVVHLGPGDLDEDGRPAESILGRPVIARWVG